MNMVDPNLYQKYLTTNQNGKTFIYVKVLKKFYVLLNSALLLYKKPVKDLEAYVPKTNPCDPCVENAIINGKQMTIAWNVDVLKISHKDPVHITKISCYISSIYGK